MNSGVFDYDKSKRLVDSGLDLRRQQLIRLQMSDSSLVELFAHARSKFGFAS